MTGVGAKRTAAVSTSFVASLISVRWPAATAVVPVERTVPVPREPVRTKHCFYGVSITRPSNFGNSEVRAFGGRLAKNIAWMSNATSAAGPHPQARHKRRRQSPTSNIADFVNQIPAVAGSLRPSNCRTNLSDGTAGLNLQRSRHGT